MSTSRHPASGDTTPTTPTGRAGRSQPAGRAAASVEPPASVEPAASARTAPGHPARPHPPIPTRHIRARFDDDTVTVYQAYAPRIGLPAARDGRFPAGWKRDRMTWIKPSFLWTMYRCGWAAKNDQETVLAVDITRDGFEWALANAALSHHARSGEDHAAWRARLRRAPARVQWDPERDLHLRPLPYRSLQLGLAGEAVHRYADEWITAVTDVTPLAYRVRDLVRAGDLDAARAALPDERPYPVHPLPHLGL